MDKKSVCVDVCLNSWNDCLNFGIKEQCNSCLYTRIYVEKEEGKGEKEDGLLSPY